MLVAHHFAHLGSSLTDSTDIQSLAFYFAKLDAEAAQLHLRVDTAHILYLAILIPAAEVACVVHADRTSPTVFFDERTIDKRLCRALGQSPVAATYLNAGKAEFTRHALWHEVAGCIDNEVPVVGNTLTYGNILHPPAGSDAIIRGVIGTLRRSIDIDNLDVVTIDAIHLLATTRGKADRQVVEGVEQQTGHCR